jgi:hypothetical protein
VKRLSEEDSHRLSSTGHVLSTYTGDDRKILRISPLSGNMIENTSQLEQALEQMGRMQRILGLYQADIVPKNPRNFAVFAEGPWDEIRKLQAEISDYLARLEQVGTA